MRASVIRCLRAACVLLAISVGEQARAQTAVVPEASLKAAYLYHFIQYTQWPAPMIADLKTFDVCIAPGSSLRAVLAVINGKMAHEKPIVVRTLDAENYGGCQVIVFNSHNRASRQAHSAKSPALNVLTVAEDEPAIDSVMIALDVEDNRVMFSINRSLAQSAGLTISSKLLRLARLVK
jgi:hypothetical protein